MLFGSTMYETKLSVVWFGIRTALLFWNRNQKRWFSEMTFLALQRMRQNYPLFGLEFERHCCFGTEIRNSGSQRWCFWLYNVWDKTIRCLVWNSNGIVVLGQKSEIAVLRGGVFGSRTYKTKLLWLLIWELDGLWEVRVYLSGNMRRAVVVVHRGFWEVKCATNGEGKTCVTHTFRRSQTDGERERGVACSEHRAVIYKCPLWTMFNMFQDILA